MRDVCVYQPNHEMALCSNCGCCDKIVNFSSTKSEINIRDVVISREREAALNKD